MSSSRRTRTFPTYAARTKIMSPDDGELAGADQRRRLRLQRRRVPDADLELAPAEPRPVLLDTVDGSQRGQDIWSELMGRGTASRATIRMSPSRARVVTSPSPASIRIRIDRHAQPRAGSVALRRRDRTGVGAGWATWSSDDFPAGDAIPPGRESPRHERRRRCHRNACRREHLRQLRERRALRRIGAQGCPHAGRDVLVEDGR
jgi:hypothetical protein